MSTPQLIDTIAKETLTSVTQDIKQEVDKSNKMSPQEERDYYMQRFQNLKMVLKEVQQQLSQYRTRCAGVDTVTLLLKESKQEVVRLNKQCKVLESAVQNLQNRLTTNGLSTSINIEETELFVPGASKQTLDNLARENARLRSLLKNTENQAGRISSEDIQSLRSQLEFLEAENSKLKIQNEDLLNTALKESLLKAQKSEQASQDVGKDKKNEKNKVHLVSRGTQTSDIVPSMIEKLKASLHQMTDQCLELASELEKAQTVTEGDFVDNNAMTNQQRELEATNQMMNQELLNWRKKYSEVVVMNERWQQHHESQEEKIFSLSARIAELENPETIKNMVKRETAQSKREAAAARAQLDMVSAQNMELKDKLETLNQELARRRSQQASFDVSIVEILKQQIQTCTEDFNSERKDREQAVQRAEQLQKELNSMKAQNEKLQADFDGLKQAKAPVVSPQRRDTHSPIRTSNANLPMPQYLARGPANTSVHDRSVHPQYSPVGAQSWLRQPSPLLLECADAGDRTHMDSPVAGTTYSRHEAFTPGSEFLSLQRPQMDFDMLPELEPAKQNLNVSMPALSVNRAKSSGTGELSCPKCDTKFLEGQDDDLIKHMDTCTA